METEKAVVYDDVNDAQEAQPGRRALAKTSSILRSSMNVLSKLGSFGDKGRDGGGKGIIGSLLTAIGLGKDPDAASCQPSPSGRLGHCDSLGRSKLSTTNGRALVRLSSAAMLRAEISQYASFKDLRNDSFSMPCSTKLAARRSDIGDGLVVAAGGGNLHNQASLGRFSVPAPAAAPRNRSSLLMLPAETSQHETRDGALVRMVEPPMFIREDVTAIVAVPYGAPYGAPPVMTHAAMRRNSAPGSRLAICSDGHMRSESTPGSGPEPRVASDDGARLPHMRRMSSVRDRPPTPGRRGSLKGAAGIVAVPDESSVGRRFTKVFGSFRLPELLGGKGAKGDSSPSPSGSPTGFLAGALAPRENSAPITHRGAMAGQGSATSAIRHRRISNSCSILSTAAPGLPNLRLASPSVTAQSSCSGTPFARGSPAEPWGSPSSAGGATPRRFGTVSLSGTTPTATAPGYIPSTSMCGSAAQQQQGHAQSLLGPRASGNSVTGRSHSILASFQQSTSVEDTDGAVLNAVEEEFSRRFGQTAPAVPGTVLEPQPPPGAAPGQSRRGGRRGISIEVSRDGSPEPGASGGEALSSSKMRLAGIRQSCQGGLLGVRADGAAAGSPPAGQAPLAASPARHASLPGISGIIGNIPSSCGE